MFATEKKQPQPTSQLFYSHKKNQDTQCQYCLKKQQLSNGDPNQRCLMHTVQPVTSLSSPSSSQTHIVDQLMDLLADVEDVLDQYWQNLHHWSGGSAEKVKEDMTPVLASISRIQQKLGRFPFDNGFSALPDIKKPSYEDRKETKSQKILSTNYAELFQDSSVNDQIKEWVMYFHKILVNRELKDEILPFDDELDMKIFKESMQKKFVTFARNYGKYENRLATALEKLLFYMEACGSNVSDKVLKEDIRFMESVEVPKDTPAQVGGQLLMMQALTIEDLLAKNESF